MNPNLWNCANFTMLYSAYCCSSREYGTFGQQHSGTLSSCTTCCNHARGRSVHIPLVSRTRARSSSDAVFVKSASEYTVTESGPKLSQPQVAHVNGGAACKLAHSSSPELVYELCKYSIRVHFSPTARTTQFSWFILHGLWHAALRR